MTIRMLIRRSIFLSNFFSSALRASVPPNCASTSSGDSALDVECWYWMDVFSDFSRSVDAIIVSRYAKIVSDKRL